MKRPFVFLIISGLILLVSSCKDSGESSQSAEKNVHSLYIQAHSDGLISASDPLIIILKQAVTNYQPGDVLPEDVFDLSPNVRGTAFLVDPDRIEFIPEEPLKNGSEYNIEFDLSKVLTLPEKQDPFSFTVEIIPLEFTVIPGTLKRDPNDPDKFVYEGKIQCSDAIDAELLDGSFSLSDSRAGIDIGIQNLNTKLLQYEIAGITQSAGRQVLELSWNTRNAGINEKGELEIEVPGANEFTVLGVYPDQGDNQQIRIVFSEETNQQQDLDGLVYLDGTEEYTLQSKGDELLLYPSTRLEGEWTLKIAGSLKSQKGIAIGSDQSYILVMSPLPPEIELLSDGYILPDAGGLFLPFKTVSLRGVDLFVYKVYSNNIQQFLQQNNPNSNYDLRGTLKYVGRPVYKKTIRLDQDPTKDLSQWNSWSVDLSPLVREDPHALYHVELRMRRNLASVMCTGEDNPDSGPIEMIPENFGENDLAGYEDSHYYYEDLYPDDYDWQERDNPCHVSYYVPSMFKYTNILATNIGVVAKSGNQKDFLIVVSDLLSADPVSNASVQFYNFQQQQILAGMTDPDGMLEVSLDQVPFIVEVSKDEQKAYLKLEDGGSLSLSNFDIAGDAVKGGVKGMIYGDRGVWRPGDTVHLTFAMFDKGQTLPEDLPVVMEVFNPQNHMVSRLTAARQTNAFYVFPVITSPDDPTGNWKAIVKAGGLTFEKKIKIETIRPNRLKVDLSFNREPLLPEDPNQYLEFGAEWLHGAPAANLRAEIQMGLSESVTQFEGFENYTFTNPLRNFWPDTYTLFNDYLNEEGKQRIPVYLENSGYAPGMLKATFTSKVFEKGGGFSTDVYSVPFSPYNRYVGVSIAEMENDRDQLVTDTAHVVQVVTVDPTGELMSGSQLVARVYKLQWNWWWSSRENDLANYIGSPHEKLVSEKVINTTNGKGSFTFRVNYPDWGRYLVHVFDPATGHGAGQAVYLDWPAWASREGRANPSGATMLTFSADQEEYQPGDKATLTFPSTADARALLTIESGERVLDAQWINTDKTETQVDFGITEEMAPNVYAALTVVQPHEHDNDLPIRQYGVLRINVSNPKSKLEPVIDLPEEIRPNAEYTVKISENTGKAMTYTLAVVDEGLLNLTRFKTPDPWNLFYAREALGVKTWDYFDDVIGAYGGRLESLLAVGGDEGLEPGEANKANRFKPVVSYLGPFELKKNKKASHTIVMPNYIGEVRAMVVAGQNDAWGSAAQSAKVRQPLMVLTNLPRRLATGEESELPVTVFVMDENIDEVQVNISLDGPVNAADGVTKKIVVDGVGEYMTSFRIRTGDETGVARIIAGVISGKESATHETEMAVLNPNPYVYNSSTFLIEKGEQAEIPVEFFGQPGTNSATLTVSGLPSFNLRENLNYLIDYPYGCLEQTTSSAFAQLVLTDMVNLSEEQKLKVDRHVRVAIRKLVNYQLPSGGFAMWPQSSGANLWASSWAGHFMIKAQKKGYVIPGSLLNNWIKFQQSRVDSYSPQSDYYGDSDLQQAYRLYTLALAGQANYSAMNRLRESSSVSVEAGWRLAAAYAISGRKNAAEEMMQRFDLNAPLSGQNTGSTFGSRLRDQAMILETFVLLNQRQKAFNLARNILTDLRVSRWNTQTTAYCFVALASFVGTDEDDLLRFKIDFKGSSEDINSQKSSYFVNVSEGDADQSFLISNQDDNPLYVEYSAYGKSTDDIQLAISNGLTMTTRFLNMEGQMTNPADLQSGTTIVAEVTVYNPVQNGFVEHLALSQVFPSGWEILSTRYADQSDGEKESPYTYRDIRDDRVNTFFSLSGGEKAVFRVRVNAAYKGEFFMPGVVCEDMYVPGRMATSEGMRVIVK